MGARDEFQLVGTNSDGSSLQFHCNWPWASQRGPTEPCRGFEFLVVLNRGQGAYAAPIAIVGTRHGAAWFGPIRVTKSRTCFIIGATKPLGGGRRTVAQY